LGLWGVRAGACKARNGGCGRAEQGYKEGKEKQSVGSRKGIGWWHEIHFRRSIGMGGGKIGQSAKVKNTITQPNPREYKVMAQVALAGSDRK